MEVRLYKYGADVAWGKLTVAYKLLEQFTSSWVSVYHSWNIWENWALRLSYKDSSYSSVQIDLKKNENASPVAKDFVAWPLENNVT